MLVGFIFPPFRQRRDTRLPVSTSRVRRWFMVTVDLWSRGAERIASGVPPVLDKSKACANPSMALWSRSTRPIAGFVTVHQAGAGPGLWSKDIRLISSFNVSNEGHRLGVTQTIAGA